MLRKACLLSLVSLTGILVLTGQATTSRTPFEYGFFVGNFGANEDASFSTWNDIHFACHFSDAAGLQRAIDRIDLGNRILVSFHNAWQEQSDLSCIPQHRWGGRTRFIGRIEPLVSTLNANRTRLLAVWLFDEPDAPHDGPDNDDLRAAIDYLHQMVPGVPVFVNWFEPERNTRLPNADWYATTNGKNPSALSEFGKPMFLWWFDNDRNPHPVEVNMRWNRMVSYFYQSAPPVIAALGWCCDSIDDLDGFANDNSTELTALLANVGQLRRDTGTVGRASYTRRPRDGVWYLFRREADGTLSYTDPTIYPAYFPFPIGGTSSFYPAVSREFRGTGTWIRILRVGEDGRLYVAWIRPDDVWVGWTQLPGRTDARPDVFRFRATTWQAIRGLDGAVYVRGDSLDTNWLNLGGAATSAPFFKVVDRKLRVAIFEADGQVYSREWNGQAWEPWMLEL